MVFEDVREFGRWQDTWCRSCATDWTTCKVLDEFFLCGGAVAIGAGPEGAPELSAYCTEYERDTEIKGVPA